MPEKGTGMNQFAVLLNRGVWLPPVMLSAVLILASYYNYLLFHTLAELFSIIVGVLMFVVAAYAHKYARDNFIMYLATGYFWVASMDLIHTLIYKGMGIYPVTIANYSTQFWIANRYVEALLLLTAPLFFTRWTHHVSKFVVFGLIAVACYVLIMSGRFPDAYIEGEGLTRFKIISEYVICTILVLALVNMYRFRDRLKQGLFPFLMASIVFTILAEISFTNYIGVYSTANLIGHIFKLFSFWMILYSIVRVSLQDPYQSLGTSRALLKGLRDGIPDLIFYKDMQGVYLGCNQAFCELIGRESESDIIGKTDVDLFNKQQAQFFRDVDQQILQAGAARRNDEWVSYPDGSRRLLDTLKTPFMDSKGGVIGVIGISRDITDNWQAEGELRKLSQALEQAGEAVMITDRDGGIEYINPAFTRVTGYRADEVLGKSLRMLKSDRQSAAFYKGMWRMLARGDQWQGKLVNRKKDGSFYPALLTISPMFDEQGAISNYIGIQQDLSEYEQLEAQFHQSQKMEAVGTLVGGIAHDFNNTLAGITGNLYLAKKAADSLPDVVDRLNSIEELAFRAAGMIQQLLTFSRKGTVQMHPISMPSFLKEVIKLQEVSVPENISLTCQVGDVDLIVNGDINLLQQALINLINNARDAVESVGTPAITVTLDQCLVDEEFLERYPAISSRDVACIRISDNGEGMSPEIQKHIFEPFFTTKGVGKGTGLGLAMVYGAIQSHGGAIAVESEEGVGTIVRIYLPLLQAGSAEGVVDDTTGVLGGRGETILLVDDEATVLATGKDVLESLGYNVLTATDGLKAVEQYIAHRDEIDLLMLDVVMPHMGGQEALRKIREITPDVRALFVTGYDKDDALGEDGDASPEMVIKKPFSINKLSQAMRALLDH